MDVSFKTAMCFAKNGKASKRDLGNLETFENTMDRAQLTCFRVKRKSVYQKLINQLSQELLLLKTKILNNFNLCRVCYLSLPKNHMIFR